MKRFHGILFLMAAAVAWQSNARADMPVVHTDDLELNLGALGQVIGVGQNLSDPYKNDDRAYLFLKEARLRSSGRFYDTTFNMELALGGEDTLVTPTNVSLGLLDLSFNIPIHAWGNSYVKVGQFKVPYGREQLTYDGYKQFGSDSINLLGFGVGRDVGATLNLVSGRKSFIAGVFTGGGRDIPSNFLPEKLALPLLVVRAGIGDIDNDLYYLHADQEEITETKAGVYVNGLFTKDSLIGHSTVLNVKLTDKNLLLNGNWNPYIGKAPFDQGEWFQAGADAAAQKPLTSTVGISGEAEVNWGGYSNKYGAVHMAGGRLQGAIHMKPIEISLRYALLIPDKNFSNDVTGTELIHEVTPAITYYIHGQNLKLIADLPISIQTPVVTEKNVGSYVLSELPNQASLLAPGANGAEPTGSVGRQTVIEGRLMVQGQF